MSYSGAASGASRSTHREAGIRLCRPLGQKVVRIALVLALPVVALILAARM